MEVDDQRHDSVALPREKDPIPTVQLAVWAPGPVWRTAENLASHRNSITGLFIYVNVKQAWTSPDGSRRMRLPDFKTIGS
jgi:hypothetical protein